MRRYRVVNLGQATGVKYLPGPFSKDTMERLCDAFKEWNDWQGWQSTETGRSHVSNAAADVASIMNKIPWGERGDAIKQLDIECPENIYPLLQSLWPLPPTTPQYPFYTPETPPPPPPKGETVEYKPVATGGEGPGAGAFGPKAPVASTGPTSYPPYMPPEPEPTGTTGSEPEPEPPPPPPQMPPTPPPVASEGNACWYVMGKGYSWGARPSGGETTGLNQAACENLIRLDREIRGLPQLTAQQPQVQQAQIADMTQNQYSWNNAAQQQQQVTTPPPVATGGPASCPPGQFWDGRQCRGSVAPGFSNLMNVASMAPATSVASGLTDFTGGGMTAATSFMGGRKKYLVQNL